MNIKVENIKKLMGWCPMKDSLLKGHHEDFFSGFKFENENRSVLSPTSPHESRILKARASIVDDRWILWVLIIVFFTLLVSLLIWTYNSPEGSFLILFSGLIWFLLPLMFLIKCPNTISVISGKIIIRRPLHKPVMIGKEDVTQISVKKNTGHSYRWMFRLFFITVILLFLSQTILSDLRILGGSAPEYPDISTFLIQLSLITLFFVQYYDFEVTAPYQRAISITTLSNLKLNLYIDEPEEILRVLKKEE